MFEKLLEPIRRSLLVEVVHYAIRLIKHRAKLSDVESGYIVRGLSSEPSPEGEQIALKVIKEIERVEIIPLQKMSEKEAEKYINMLADIVDQRYTEELGYDRRRGQELLEELRKSSIEHGAIITGS
jgi:hypothetical protein